MHFESWLNLNWTISPFLNVYETIAVNPLSSWAQPKVCVINIIPFLCYRVIQVLILPDFGDKNLFVLLNNFPHKIFLVEICSVALK